MEVTKLQQQYIKLITNKDIQYVIENSTQYSIITYMGKASEKNGYIYIYIYKTDIYIYNLIDFAVQLKLTQHCKSNSL